jgi:hypothetical protein
MDIPMETITDLLRYDPDTGAFVWLAGRRRGKVAGCVMKDGYRAINIGGRMVYAHRLAWLMSHGALSSSIQIDHRDGDRDNNSLANLREASAAENAQNRRAHKDNKSGLQGVSMRKGRYIAQIMAHGKHAVLGYCSTAEEAHTLYLEAKAARHLFQPVPRAV